jgi:hypothetical protein
MLACKTSEDALVKGGFSATAEVHVMAGLATCRTISISIDIVDSCGRFDDIV